MKQVAEEIVKPNDRLSSMERIEIYSRSYWFRIISSLNEDFVGLRAVVGDSKFDALIQAYLAANPSRSFTRSTEMVAFSSRTSCTSSGQYRAARVS